MMEYLSACTQEDPRSVAGCNNPRPWLGNMNWYRHCTFDTKGLVWIFWIEAFWSMYQHFSTLLYSALLYSTLLYPALLYSTLLYSTSAPHTPLLVSVTRHMVCSSEPGM